MSWLSTDLLKSRYGTPKLGMAIQAKMSEIEHELQGSGRLVVRYSGTEPLLRVMIESDSAEKNERLINGLLETIRMHL